ncbi:MAG TPA: NAD(P)-dependent oxidoreductase [Longimicrobium sp.]|nr:NAD(P)-dependent oxidoreductase [Longimicrobium sp.]
MAEPAGFAPEAAELLRGVARVRLEDLDRAGLLARAGAAEVLWVRLRTRVDAEVMDAAPALRVIATATTGLNHVDLDEAARRGVRVLSLRGETAFLKDIRATAEHTLALMLALLRHLPAAAGHARAGGWDRDRFRGRELHGATVGIVGLGRVGRIVARYLAAFDARVLACDVDPAPEAPPPGVTVVPLDRLLAESDIVSLHASYAPESHGFFNRDCFGRMKPGARFVNTARGELVDEGALLDALRSGRLAGAAVDVLADETGRVAGSPLVAHAREHENLVVTPHIGGATVESMARTEVFLARRLVALLRPDAPAHP